MADYVIRKFQEELSVGRYISFLDYLQGESLMFMKPTLLSRGKYGELEANLGLFLSVDVTTK
jgi:hypothetical protein